MRFVSHLACMLCDAIYDPKEVTYVCPDHGNEGILDVIYDYEAIGRSIDRDQLSGAGMWRYRPLLPIEGATAVPSLQVGWTPLQPTPRLASHLGLQYLWVKDDGLNPTGSLKDRASAMAVAKATERGAQVITTASSGNAAAALSGLSASAGLTSVLFVPASAPPAKIAQMQAYGAVVFLVDDAYDAAFDLCLEAAAAFGWYNRNTGYNPYMSEGKKTVSLEICEQLGWEAPDVIFVSVGDGCIIGGVYKGLWDALQVGFIEKMPRIIGVQAAGSPYLVEAWERGEDVRHKPPAKAQSVADSINVGLPRDRLKAMRAVKASAGAYLAVSDEAILEAMALLAQTSGIFAEPAGATALAGLIKAKEEGRVASTERIVVLNTGNGLKDVPAVQQSIAQTGSRTYTIAAHMDELYARQDLIPKV